MPIKNKRKKEILAKQGRRTKWAPIWAVLKKYGRPVPGGAQQMTSVKRSWRRTKLHVKPRKARPKHYG